MINLRQIFTKLLIVLTVLTIATPSAMALQKDSAGNYMITSVEDYKELMKTNSLWAAGNKFVQMVDLDFNNEVLTPIGNPTTYFYASYDGRGHKIENATIYWEYKNNNNGYGLFGCVKGSSGNLAKICNLILENCSLTVKPTATKPTSLIQKNLYLGILAGFINQYVQIENISIVNGNIKDDGKDLDIHALYCGGVIGGLAEDLGKTDDLPTGTGYSVKNIFCDANLDFSSTNGNEKSASSLSNYYQLYTAGILGRVRSATDTLYVPKYIVYTGQIINPWGSEAPIVANMRDNQKWDGDFHLISYACELNGKTISQWTTDEAGFGKFCSTRVYYNYKAYNSNSTAENKIEEVNLSNPDPYKEYKHRTRTFLPNKNISTDDIKSHADDISYRAAAQGVNFGAWRNHEEESDRKLMTGLLNKDLDTKVSNDNTISRYYWDWNSTTKKFDLKHNIDPAEDLKIEISISDDGNSYIAALHPWDPNDNVTDSQLNHWLTNDFNLEWQRTSIANDESSWTSFDETGVTCKVSYANFFYRVKGTATFGSKTVTLFSNVLEAKELKDLYKVEVTSNIFGNILTATVYDKITEHEVSESLLTNTTYQWEVTTTPDNDESWAIVDGATSSILTVDPIPNGESPKYYRVKWTKGGAFIYSNALKITSLNERFAIKIEIDFDNNNYTAKIHIKDEDEDITSEIEDQGIYDWQYTFTPKDDESWHSLGVNSRTYPISESSEYYRVIWTKEDLGVTLVSDYRSSRSTIYVFNRETTESYLNLFGVNAIDLSCLKTDDGSAFKYPDGDDANYGATPYDAVKTMKRAYELVNEAGDFETNIIVVMGYYYEDDFLKKNNNYYGRPATLTGFDNKYQLNNGILALISKDDGDYRQLGAPLRLDRIKLHSHEKENFLYIVCNFFDFTVDQDVEVLGYKSTEGKGNGLPDGMNTMPHISVIAAAQDCNDHSWPQYTDKKGYYTEQGYSHVKLRSGCFGRVMCGGRNHTSTTYNLLGSPSNPVRTKLTVDITGINLDNNRVSDNFNPYGKKVHWGDKKYISPSYTHDIGLLTGGQTDGSIYADVEINIRNGYIGRLLAGNITFGREIKNYPDDSFFGSTRINIYGQEIEFEEDGKKKSHFTTTINEIYGGSLGRSDAKNLTKVVKAYFYGESFINLYGGRIAKYTGDGLAELKEYEPNIYGTGAGGVSGLGDAYHHTPDDAIPYINNNDELKYGTYERAIGAGYSMPKMNVDNGRELDLANTSSSVNIYGGLVEGNIFGAGFGYTNSFYIYKNVPGYDDANDENCIAQAGVLYGDSYVTMARNKDIQPGRVLGNIYGGGAGSDEFFKAWKTDNPSSDDSKNPFRQVATQYGNCHVTLKAGTVGDGISAENGNVYAGARGVEGYDDIAAIYGNTTIEINGATIYGDIYGGSGLANIRKRQIGDDNYDEDSGNAYVTVKSGTIGNNIFGGSMGSEGTKPSIERDTYVTVNGGDFIGNPYFDTSLAAQVGSDGKLVIEGKEVNIIDNPELYRTFNIYGGGNLNCDILGSSHVKVYSSLLKFAESFADARQNPNAQESHRVEGGDFYAHYMDVTFRRFGIYGGGYGEKTNVKNTNVYVTIPRDRPNVGRPYGEVLHSFLEHQSFFDIAGGGYSGDVGYWVDKDGNITKNIDKTGKTDSEIVDLYDHYIDGHCQVVIDDYTFARKVIGGGFYGSCASTNTHVRCGSLRQVYGGSLLGDVHDKAFLQFGNRIEDFIGIKDGDYVLKPFDRPEIEEFDGNISEVQNKSVWNEAAALAKSYNDYIYISENIYGGNDVKGIIGTIKWEAPQSTATNPVFGIDHTDKAPLFQTDINKSEEKGIVFNIYGGTFSGDVYGAGNGHYRGYYVPGWLRYYDGPARMYRTLKSGHESNNEGKVYRSRPMVGSVNVNVRGNSENDRINIHGNFFGGGRECTIGQWDTFLPMEDPRRLLKGGHLHVNFGGYTHIDGNVYLGAEGQMYGTQYTVPSGIDLDTFDGSTTSELDKLGDVAYDHWYYNGSRNRYEPGYPSPGTFDGNFGMTGEHMFRGYMKNIEMEGDVELTFYRTIYERDADGKYKYLTDSKGDIVKDSYGRKVRKRRRWQPAETALIEYNAEDVKMNSFFLGGLCGSMTNNQVMIYDYTDKTDIAEGTAPDGHDVETSGAVYRVTLPAGVTLRENLVMGSENATTKYYGFKDKYCTEPNDEVEYIYEGGMVTHSAYAFDLIAYNDNLGLDSPARELPEGFYTDNKDEYKRDGTHIKDLTEWTVINGDHTGETFKRLKYDPNKEGISSQTTGGHKIDENRYALAVYTDATQTEALRNHAYIGVREKRRENGQTSTDPVLANKMTVSKLAASCKFDLLIAPDPNEGSTSGSAPIPYDASDHAFHYGANIYGGCYNSGIVIGDVVLNIGSDLIGGHLDAMTETTYNKYASLKYNNGRVFGGGYGKDTRMEGDTYVNLLRNFRGMNVFGGGMEGNVTGSTNIVYLGSESDSFVFGAIYGGGLRGDVGTQGVTKRSTSVHLISGNVNKVYGGSCMGQLYGRTYVELNDEVSTQFSHLDLERFLKSPLYDDWTGSRLIAGSVFGGNDIAGLITPTPGEVITPNDPENPTEAEKLEQLFSQYTTTVYVHEVPDTNTPTQAPSQEPTAPGKTSPGSSNGYNGFPLIGNLYGGSNAEYGSHDIDKYKSGTVEIATGNKADFITVDLAPSKESALDIPHVKKACLKIDGGSIINAYGGGNMSTITESAHISVNYPSDSRAARAGFETKEEFTRLWAVLNISSDQQQDEVTIGNEEGKTIFKEQVFRLFGGNDNADMAIQPEWELKSGHIGSLYSGGNFGKMTYFKTDYSYDLDGNGIEDENDDYSTYHGTNSIGADTPASTWQAQGLTLTINSDDITIDNVYGGGRVGAISPPDDYSKSDKFFGATLNIVRGTIEHVYGGNDVAGYVADGTNVNIYGAISGDVYCAGNGNYLYRYDRNGNLFDYSNSELNLNVTEKYEYETDEYKGARHFWLPAKEEYGFDKTTFSKDAEGKYSSAYRATDAQTVLAINSYRPNVERAKMYISGTAANRVWIKGNVYCGGNSATVVSKDNASVYDVEFKIGSNVVINGVFMGSNGESLADGAIINLTEKLNSLDVTKPNNLLSKDSDGNYIINDGKYQTEYTIPDADKSVLNPELYPNILDLYMCAVDIMETPKNFNFPADLQDAYIGEFCVGGNRGSMMTPNTINLTFPESLTIYGRIIGGCKNANVEYKAVTHYGGLTMPMTDIKSGVKVDMKIKSKFRPLGILYPDVDATPPISLTDLIVDVNDNPISASTPASDARYYRNLQCNVYGGCFTSGKTIGAINIDLYSDMLQYDNDGINKQAVINGIKDIRSLRSFTVIGGGYGLDTEVWGDIRLRMLPEVSTTGDTRVVTHPSAASVFGGAQEGLVVGNTRVEVRDGKILANLYGASEAAKMYGSTSVIVGYPKYYRCKKSGVYKVNRTDYMSTTARTGIKEGDDERDRFVVAKTIAYREGDIVPCNVMEMILAKVKRDVARTPGFEIGQDVAETDYESAIIPLYPDSNKDYTGAEQWQDYFEEVVVDKANSTEKTSITPEYYGAKWDDIEIWIGDQKSNRTNDASVPYYGQGNIYGGGYIPNSANMTLTGKKTVLYYNQDFHPIADDADYQGDLSVGLLGNRGFGGNTAVMIWDNKENATASVDSDGKYEKSSDGSEIKDHVHVGTGRYLAQPYLAGASKMGLYIKKTGANGDYYEYQTAGLMEEGETYYRKDADGGVYGGGRKVFVEGFTSIDLAYYGYADHSPQNPKLLNTIQRSNVVTILDCCMELVGASDFTVDDVDMTLYAINRVGELRMNSSLDPEENLDSGTINTAENGIRVHDKPRTRNYVAFYHSVNHLAAFRSNWSMEKKYHRHNGQITEETNNGSYSNGSKSSFVNHKHDIIDVYYAYNEYKNENSEYTKAKVVQCYKKYITNHNEYNVSVNDIGTSISDLDPSNISDDQFVTIEKEIIELFNRRNVASSANMIGINSGFSLRFEGLNKDGIYYGPVYGVTELKLLTAAVGEGGGYIYALNHHYDPAIDTSAYGMETGGWCSAYGHDFLMTTGNFVFPGAAYFIENEGAKEYNYIIDDCYPLNHGFYEYERDYKKNHAASSQALGAAAMSGFNVNNEQEVHYWYVNGQQFTYNVTVTGITSDKPMDFFLNNETDIVNFINLTKDHTLQVAEVTWFNHEDGDLDSTCDIVDLTKNYKLFLTIDHNSHNYYSYENHPTGAYISEIPRENYKYESSIITAGQPNPNNNNGTWFGDYNNEENEAVTNSARLGIRLMDTQANRLESEPASVGRQYFSDHLDAPHQVQIVLKATKDDEPMFTYNINLTIEYILGPLITGNIVIENCALPGEYIYVNADGVNIDMDDENLGTTEQYWKLYPNKDGHRIDKDMNLLSDDGYILDADGNPTTTKSDAVYENLNDDAHAPIYTIEQKGRTVHLPAYWYQNGWEVAYCAEVSGFEFESTLPYSTENRLLIHNYHRMKPRYEINNKPLDLRLVAGARVYIEDDEDMEYFFQYLAEHQYADDGISLAGDRIGPRYAEGINFNQMVNANIPNGDGTVIFRGNYHGMGHNMTIPDGVRREFENEGYFYNVGFISNSTEDGSHAFSVNRGSLINCYYFNIHGKGSFLGGEYKDIPEGHKISNCYENTLSQKRLTQLGYNYDEILHLSTQGFRYGQAAYNLNGFYLQKRHALLHKGYNGDNGAANNAYALNKRNTEVRATDEYANYAVPYVERLYENGDYLYQYYKENEHDGHWAGALRTKDDPNYLDYLGIHSKNTGEFISNHKKSHDKDMTRWCDAHQCYHPNYEVDYIFFGEDLSGDTHVSTELPIPYTAANRVYRVGGFYGSASDKGYFMNRDAFLDTPHMTAIDFVGYRDRDIYESFDDNGSHGALKSDICSDIEDNGWRIVPGVQEVLYPPTIDVPWAWSNDEATDLRHDFGSFVVNSDIVTHNLLIYTPIGDEINDKLTTFHYTDAAPELGNDEHSFAQHDDSGILAHHISDDGSGPSVYGNYFHLVDNHDFNAPIEFTADEVWYNRKPNDYANEYTIEGESGVYSYKTAWEGICLPFAVAKTYAASTNLNLMNDIGEITHFYGDDWKGHEYWLRRLEDVGENGLHFGRPTADNDKPSNTGGAKDNVVDYYYSNSSIYDLYHEYEYDSTMVIGHRHDVLYHDESGTLNRKMKDYRQLSAGIPYVVSYPGERYYEFDLSGKFYASKNTKVTSPVPQSICYFANKEEGKVTIPVTDKQPIAEYTTQSGVTLKGTFQHVTNDAGLAESILYNREDNMAVLDVYIPSTDEMKYYGEQFVPVANAEEGKTMADADIAVVLPFRVYVTSSGSNNKPLRIGSREIYEENQEEEIDPEEPQNPEDEMQPGIEVWAEGKALMVRTPYDVDLYVFNTVGQVFRHIRAYEGVNRYSGIPSGFYIVNGTKILLK